MAPWLLRRIPWKVAFAGALWLAEKGKDRLQANLTQKEQQELLRLVRKSKGRPGNLAKRDRTRLKNLAGKALRG
jgi:hypothetical protein